MPSREELTALTVKALQAELKAKGLNVKGVKAELVERLLEASEARAARRGGRPPSPAAAPPPPPRSTPL